MTMLLASTFLPLLRWMEPERAHSLALKGLALGLAGRDRTVDDPRLHVETLGRRFDNPLGLAAGFDKNAVAIDGLSNIGFGFIETGTVTPRPQAGNPRPRLFRLPEDRAVINRMGFNNAGLQAYVGRLQARRTSDVPVGANVGINKEGADPLRDYPALVQAVAPYADYVVVNVSSPNTPGLRDLQGEDRLRGILQAINAEVPKRPPLLVKLAPDLADAGLAAIVETCVAEHVDGLIISNTTISRPAGLKSLQVSQPGGLSGAPLFALSTAVLRRVAQIAAGRLVLIGVGGVFSGADILTKLRAGATLVQIYSGFAYGGPAMIPRLKRELLAALDRAGFADVTAAIGADLR